MRFLSNKEYIINIYIYYIFFIEFFPFFLMTNDYFLKEQLSRMQ